MDLRPGWAFVENLRHTCTPSTSYIRGPSSPRAALTSRGPAGLAKQSARETNHQPGP